MDISETGISEIDTSTPLTKKVDTYTFAVARHLKDKEALFEFRDEIRFQLQAMLQRNEKSYHEDIIKGALAGMRALTAGASPERAKDAIIEYVETGTQIDFASQLVYNYHPRGEDFKNYFNALYVGEERAKEIPGLINPNIIGVKLDKAKGSHDVTHYLM